MKGTVKRIRRQTTDWEKIHANDISDKGQLSKIYKDLLNLNNDNVNDLIKKWMGKRPEQTPHQRRWQKSI